MLLSVRTNCEFSVNAAAHKSPENDPAARKGCFPSVPFAAAEVSEE